MIYDCFIFFNELEILDIRLHTLDAVVDKFIICEATKDHANKPKSLYFEENKQKFKKFKNKIVYIKVTDLPNTNLPWVHVDHQWAAVAKGLKNCELSDTILISDVDEIPKPERIIEWKDRSGKVKIFLQSLSYYYLNCVNYVGGQWQGTRMMKYKYLMKYRMHAAKNLIPDVKIPDGGWHFSFIGDVEKIQKKITTTGHQEFNTEKYKNSENIKLAIAQGKDFLNHGLKFKIVDKSFLPPYVLKNQSKFKNLLIDKLEKETPYYFMKYIFLTLKLQSKLSLRKIKLTLKKALF